MRKLLGGLAVLFVGYFLITQPEAAADVVRQALGMAQDVGESAVDSVSAFVTSLQSTERGPF